MAKTIWEIKTYGMESGDTAFVVSNASGTSLLSLGDTGNATIAGTLAVTGAQTFTGNTTISGTLGVTGIATFTAALQAASAQHLLLNTQSDDKQVRINSRNYAAATGNTIGFQSKPAQTVSKTSDNVIGCEISPRLNSGIALASGGTIIGAHIDTYLKGTAAGTVAGDVRGVQIEQVTDDAGTRTISGNVNAIRIRTAFSATTISGVMAAIRIENPEAQTNSKTYDYVLDLTGTNTAWDDTDTATGDTEAGFIRVRVNNNTRRIQLFSDES